MSNKKTFLGVELSSSKKVNFLTFTALLLLIFSIVGGYYLYEKKENIYAPMYVDSSPTYGVVFNIDHALYRTDRDGTLLEGLSFKSLHLKEVADVKFFNGSLLVLQGDGKVKRCELPLGSCREFASAPSYRADMYMRIIPSKDEKYFYVIQTNKSKIDKFDKEGKHLYRLNTKQKNVKYPRGGVALSNDTLLLADTGHKRVIVLQDKGENNVSVIWSYSTKDLPFKSSYSRVLDVKFDTTHNIWITNTDKNYEKAHTFSLTTENLKEILENSSALSNKPMKINTNKATHIQSKSLKYPGSLTPHREGMLIADENTFKLFYVDETFTPTLFGDGYIQAKLKKIYNQKTFYQDILYIIMGLFGLAILMAIVAAILEMPISAKQMLEGSKEIKHNEEPTISEEKKIEPNDAGVIWVLPNEKLLKQFKWLKYLFIVITIFMFYSISTQFVELDNIGRFILLLPLGGLFFVYNNLNYTHHAIGIDDEYLYIQTSKTKKARASFSEVLYSTENVLLDNSSPTRIAIDTVTLPLFHSNEKGIYGENSLFDKEQFDYYIKPKLLEAKKISWQSMLEKQIKNIDYKEWALITFFIFLMSIVYSLTTISK